MTTKVLNLKSQSLDSNYVLGKYGKMILDYMVEEQEDRYIDLVFTGEIYQLVYEKELYLNNLYINLTKELMVKNPRPITNNIMEMANHLSMINDIVENQIILEIKKTI